MERQGGGGGDKLREGIEEARHEGCWKEKSGRSDNKRWEVGNSCNQMDTMRNSCKINQGHCANRKKGAPLIMKRSGQRGGWGCDEGHQSEKEAEFCKANDEED